MSNFDFETLINGYAALAKRPLRISELALLVEANLGAEDLKLTAKDIVRTHLGPLLAVSRDETVKPANGVSVESLLNSKSAYDPPDTLINEKNVHTSIAIACVRSLGVCIRAGLVEQLYDSTKEAYVFKKAADNQLNVTNLPHEIDLLNYALENWEYHCQECDSEDADLFLALDDLMDALQFWHTTNKAKFADYDYRNVLPMPLHRAAAADLKYYIIHLLACGADLNVIDPIGRSALTWTAVKGHTRTAAVLIERGATTGGFDRQGYKPIHYAAQKNHHTVLKHLLAAGERPMTATNRRIRTNSPTSFADEWTALQIVCRNGYKESLMEMLSYLENKDLEYALCSAADSGRHEIVSTLLTSTTVSPDSTLCGNSALYLAAHRRDLDCIRLLLDRGANVHTKSRGHSVRPCVLFDEGGEPGTLTPVQGYVSGKNAQHAGKTNPGLGQSAEALALLIDAGAEFDTPDPINGCTPLMQSVRWHSFDNSVIKLLLERGANAAVEDKDGRNIFQNRYKHGPSLHPKLIEWLIKKGANINAVHAATGRTPLLDLCDENPNSIGEMEVFIRHGANCKAVDIDGNTGVHILVGGYAFNYDEESNARMLESTLQKLDLLLNAGCDVNATNKKGKTCFHVIKHTKEEHRNPLLQKLLEYGGDINKQDYSGRTLLFASPSIANLLKLGADPMVRDYRGKGVMHYAKPEELDVLIANGVDPHSRDFDGNTILHDNASIKEEFCYTDRFVAKIKKILSFGIPIDVRNYKGETPLHFNANQPFFPGPFNNNQNPREEDNDPLDFFTSYEPPLDLNAKDNDGVTPLHLAAISREYTVSRLLIAGADPSVVNNEGRSPLHCACRARQSNAVGILIAWYKEIKKQGMIDHADRYGRTALHDACRSGRLESVQLLLEAGANPNAVDIQGRTPLYACAEFPEEEALWRLVLNPREDVGVHVIDRFRPYVAPQARRTAESSWSGEYEDLDEHGPAHVGQTVRLLLAHEADPLISKVSPYELSLVNKCEEMSRVFEATGNKEAETQELAQTSGSTLDLTLLDEETAKNRLTQMSAEQATEYRIALYKAVATGDFDQMRRLKAAAKHSDSQEFLSKLPKSLSRSLLTVACQRRVCNLQMIRLLVEELGFAQDADASGGPAKIASALNVLAKGKHWWHTIALEYLLQKGADPNCVDDSGVYPLHTACLTAYGRLGFWRHDCIRLLLQYGADPNIVNSDNRTCLFELGSGYRIAPLADIRVLLQHGAKVNAGGKSLLFNAIKHGKAELVKVLLENGADPNQPKPHPEKPNSRFKMHGAKIFSMKHGPKQNKYTQYPLVNAAVKHRSNVSKSEQIIASLLLHGADYKVMVNDKSTLLHYVCENGGVLGPFITNGNVDLNLRDPQGRTPIMVASLQTSVQALLDVGVHLEVEDLSGRNLMHHLAIRQEGKVFTELLSRPAMRAMAFQPDKVGFTPIHLALAAHNIDTSRDLIAAGADPLAPDPNGDTALHHLAEALYEVDDEHAELFKACLARSSAALDARNAVADTPLLRFLAASSAFQTVTKDSNCVTTFDAFFATADLHVRNMLGQSALHLLAGQAGMFSKNMHDVDQRRKYNAMLFHLLMEQGLDPHALDAAGRSAVDVAAAAGDEDILELFREEA